jgi:hypothetical protein
MSERTYLHQFVLYLDILGFEQYVNDDKHSGEFGSQMLTNLMYINDYAKEYKPSEVRITQFSDTFIVTSSVFIDIIVVAEFLQRALHNVKLLSRGAITYGKVFHNGSQFIGPAINRAYNLEKSEAIYPRVIIDPLCEREITIWHINGDVNPEHILALYAVKDFDGYWYVDYLDSKYLIVEFDKVIKELYEKYKNTKHRGKYTWLKLNADQGMKRRELLRQ